MFEHPLPQNFDRDYLVLREWPALESIRSVVVDFYSVHSRTMAEHSRVVIIPLT